MLKLSDTLTGEKREFKPNGDVVRIYVCGVTPYSSAHVGHAMSYIVFDVLHRYLEFKEFTVQRVQNFTDIDDKLITRANERGISVAVSYTHRRCRRSTLCSSRWSPYH